MINIKQLCVATVLMSTLFSVPTRGEIPSDTVCKKDEAILHDTTPKNQDTPFDFSLVQPSITAIEGDINFNISPAGPPKHHDKIGLVQLPEWLIKSSLDNAPLLLKGICAYLASHQPQTTVRSFHRFILVGEPGTGKTTLAKALALNYGYHIHYVSASSFLGHFRNETAEHIQKFFNGLLPIQEKTVVIIDELHKLFEGHKNEHTDHSESAAAFWLALDKLEAHNPHVVVIGTANNVNKLPSEIKSRFHGKIITISPPSQEYRLQALRDIAFHDASILLDVSIDDDYLAWLNDQVNGWSLRDIQLLFDTAKMFSYAEGYNNSVCITLNQHHLDNALHKLDQETVDIRGDYFDRIEPTLHKVALVLSVTVSIGTLIQMAHLLANSQLASSLSKYFSTNITL